MTSFSPCPAEADRLRVTASIFPLYDFAREVAGNEADVELLLPPGASPHTWEPRPSDIIRVSKADVFLYVSGEMEPWADNLIRAVGRESIRTLEVLESVGARGEESHPAGGSQAGGNGHSSDPHFWLDLSLAARAVEAVGRTLAEVDPSRASGFTSRAAQYSRRLMDLDTEFASGLERCRTRTFVTGGHSAFGYLAQRYGLVQVPLYGMSPDSEPTPARLAAVVERMRLDGIGVVFFEEMANPRLAAVLASEAGASTMVLVPAGNITALRREQGATFIGIMEANLAVLREGLSCE